MFSQWAFTGGSFHTTQHMPLALNLPTHPPHPPTLSTIPVQVPAADLREYRQRLASERAAERAAASRGGGLGLPQPAVDHYQLLGLERSATVEEVRRQGGGGVWGIAQWRRIDVSHKRCTVALVFDW